MADDPFFDDFRDVPEITAKLVRAMALCLHVSVCLSDFVCMRLLGGKFVERERERKKKKVREQMVFSKVCKRMGCSRGEWR